MGFVVYTPQTQSCGTRLAHDDSPRNFIDIVKLNVKRRLSHKVKFTPRL